MLDPLLSSSISCPRAFHRSLWLTPGSPRRVGSSSPWRLSASRICQGPELIGCNLTAVPLQSLGWGQELGGYRKESTHPFSLSLLDRGHTPLSSHNGCRDLRHPAVRKHLIVPWSLRTVPCPQYSHQIQRMQQSQCLPQGQCPAQPGYCSVCWVMWGGEDSKRADFTLLVKLCKADRL